MAGNRSYYETYQDHRGEWRWRFKASNGRLIADSGEGYVEERDMLTALDLVRGSSGVPIKGSD